MKTHPRPTPLKGFTFLTSNKFKRENKHHRSTQRSQLSQSSPILERLEVS